MSTTKSWRVEAPVSHPSHLGSVSRRILILAGVGKNARPYLKNNQRKKGFDVVQVVECLPSKHKALSSNPSTTKKRIPKSSSRGY
jgi:hypothetical protein